MSRTGGDVGSGETPKKPASLAKTLLMLAIGMSAFAYAMLSTNKFVIPAAILLLTIFEVYALVKGFSGANVIGPLCEVEYFVVLLSLLYGAYHGLFAGHPGVLYVTILYRPQYTVYRNQRIALVLGLLIMTVAVPITLGMVSDESAVDMLTGLYGFLVAGLWVFCSKFGGWAFGSAAR
ncbi:MAG: hypothetical protein LAO07_07490 [Acidobacteriia bacterium]|nr:hypothetical protein [Terriglobia bacterium]